MKIYISGISGTGMGPLALMAKAAGFTVMGSDLSEGAIFPELKDADIEVKIGSQDGEFLRAKIKDGVDWFVYTSALHEDHPELALAREYGIKVTKRDEFTAFLIEKLGLKLLAVAGTHGKTTTTSMIIYAALRLGLPVSYIVGTTLGFAKSGAYDKNAKYFIYEADEYDRNFLKFHPWLSVITSISYDHPDIYKTRAEYEEAFGEFMRQSESVISKDSETEEDESTPLFSPSDFKLAGAVRREDAAMAAAAVSEIYMQEIYDDMGDMIYEHIGSREKREPSAKNQEEPLGLRPEMTDEYITNIINILNDFPGVGRRFERLADGIYTDYAHHPEEIAATLEIAQEEAEILGKKGVVAIYEPHQNTRQHEVFAEYKDAFKDADKLFWLPTFLTRENPDLHVITPAEFIESLTNSEIAEPAETNADLLTKIREFRAQNYLILLLTAGPADHWLRENLKESNNF